MLIKKNAFLSRLFHSVITAGKKGIFEKNMSGFETCDYIALRTSCSIEIFVLRNQLKGNVGDFS